MTSKLTTILIICVAILQSCSQSPFQGNAQKEGQALTSPSTKTIEPSRTPRPSPSPSPTNTAIPPEIIDAAKQSYLAMLSIQINAGLVDEVAERIQYGEFTGYDRYGAMLAVAALIEGAHRSAPQIAPPVSLSGPWDKMQDVHRQTKEIIRAWFNDEINTGEVRTGVAPIINEADNALLEAEQIMSNTFNFDPDTFMHERERILGALPTILEPRVPAFIE
jgi:hypothetical protein